MSFVYLILFFVQWIWIFEINFRAKKKKNGFIQENISNTSLFLLLFGSIFIHPAEHIYTKYEKLKLKKKSDSKSNLIPPSSMLCFEPKRLAYIQTTWYKNECKGLLTGSNNKILLLLIIFLIISISIIIFCG